MVAQRTLSPLWLLVLATTQFAAPLSKIWAEEPLGVSQRAASELAFSGVHDSARGKRSFSSLGSKQASLEQEPQHPLRPLLIEARQALEYIEQEVQDYTCTLVKRERIAGKLLPQETLFAKVLHGKGEVGEEASSSDCVYLRYDSPAALSGREVLFKRGGAPHELLVRNGGQRLAFLTLELDPTCALAMRGTRYPVTEFGIKRLVERMIRLGEKELEHAECEVRIDEQATLDGRRNRCIEVLHPQRRDYFVYHIARIYIDQELQLPVRFEAYDWPNEPGAEPPVLEEYSYGNIQLNVGLSPEDFQRDHPDYSFSRR